MNENVGGNLVKSFSLTDKTTLFADDAYKYYKTFLKDGETHNVEELKSYTIMVMNTEHTGHITLGEKTANPGQAVVITEAARFSLNSITQVA